MSEMPEMLQGSHSSIVDAARWLGRWLHYHGERHHSAELAEAFCRADKTLERLVAARASAFSAAGVQTGADLWDRTETKVLDGTNFDYRGAVPVAWRHTTEVKKLNTLPSGRKSLVDDAWVELTQLVFLVHRIALRHGFRLVIAVGHTGSGTVFSFHRSVEWE